MERILIVVGLGTMWAAPYGLAGEKKYIAIDLQPKATQKLTDAFGRGVEGNNLAELPTGEQTFADVRFQIGPGLLQLASTLTKGDLPKKIEGVEVGRSFSRLHLLHATGFGAYGKDGDPLFLADDTQIGEYKVHYADKTTASIPIVYGKDVRDWWNWDNSKGVTRSKVAWVGSNDYAKQNNVQLRLYQSTWKNPYPAKRVTHIDYVAVGDTICCPFCVAMTIETKR